jgi:hypothetical protein
MPSAVFMSVTDFPTGSATVWVEPSRVPSAMPIFATPSSRDTSLNSGFAAGKVPSTLTLSTTPLTESEATVGTGGLASVGSGVVLVGDVDPGVVLVGGGELGSVVVGEGGGGGGGGAGDGSVDAGLVEVGSGVVVVGSGVVVVGSGVVVAGGVAVGGGETGGSFGVVKVGGTGPVVVGSGAFVSCGWNGSLLFIKVKATSWPSDALAPDWLESLAGPSGAAARP